MVRVRHVTLAALLLLTASLRAQVPSRAQIDAILDRAKAEIDALFAPPVTTVTSSNLQAAIDEAATGSVLQLAPNLVVSEPVVIAKSLTILGTTTTPATATAPMPALRGGVWITAGDVVFKGIDFRLTGNPWGNVVEVWGAANVTFDSVRGLGDPVTGQKRFIAANGGRVELTRSICDDIFSTSDDAQCVAAWDTPGPIVITNNPLLRASGENILIGGGDPSSSTRVPTDITITGNYLAKKLAWKGTSVLVKNLIELKNARKVQILKNTLEYNFSGGQAGHAVVFTPRNQDGSAPYSSVEDVTFADNAVRHVAAAVQLLGSDNEQPSGPLRLVTFLRNTFEDVNPKTWRGSSDASDQMILVVRGPQDVTFDTNTFTGANIGSVVYFADLPKSQRFNLLNNRWPKSSYGIFGADSAVGAAWAQWVASGTLSGNSER